LSYTTGAARRVPAVCRPVTLDRKVGEVIKVLLELAAVKQAIVRRGC
jgi:hypothetical protein